MKGSKKSTTILKKNPVELAKDLKGEKNHQCNTLDIEAHGPQCTGKPAAMGKHYCASLKREEKSTSL